MAERKLDHAVLINDRKSVVIGGLRIGAHRAAALTNDDGKVVLGEEHAVLPGIVAPLGIHDDSVTHPREKSKGFLHRFVQNIRVNRFRQLKPEERMVFPDPVIRLEEHAAVVVRQPLKIIRTVVLVLRLVFLDEFLLRLRPKGFRLIFVPLRAINRIAVTKLAE